MFQSSGGGGNPSTGLNLPSFNQESVHHILLGEYGAIIDTMNAWPYLATVKGRLERTPTHPTGRNGEYMSVMPRKRTSP